MMIKRLIFAAAFIVAVSFSSYAQGRKIVATKTVTTTTTTTYDADTLALNKLNQVPVESDMRTFEPVRSNHSISVSNLGLEYAYEQRLGGNFSLVARTGGAVTANAFYQDLASFNLNLLFAYSISVEPRIYTSLGRRASLGKSTHNNSSDFASAKFAFYYAGSEVGLSFTPMYGIRRAWGRHWFHEFSVGPTLSYIDGFSFTPHIQYRLAFVF